MSQLVRFSDVVIKKVRGKYPNAVADNPLPGTPNEIISIMEQIKIVGLPDPRMWFGYALAMAISLGVFNHEEARAFLPKI